MEELHKPIDESDNDIDESNEAPPEPSSNVEEIEEKAPKSNQQAPPPQNIRI